MRDPVGWWVLVFLLPALAVVGQYLAFSARRLDRLHRRVAAARAALDEQLTRRAEAGARLAALLDRVPGAALAASAVAVQRSSPGVREQAESDFTASLREALSDPAVIADLRADPQASTALTQALRAGQNVRFARRFHNDAVAAAQRVRRKWVVRWFRLAGRAAMPQMVELDDGDDLTPYSAP